MNERVGWTQWALDGVVVTMSGGKDGHGHHRQMQRRWKMQERDKERWSKKSENRIRGRWMVMVMSRIFEWKSRRKKKRVGVLKNVRGVH